MEMPNIADRVWYVLPSKRFTAAIIIRVHNETTVDLVVFADASEGNEYATGTAVKYRVPLYVKQPGDEYPSSNTWFVPQGQFLPHQ